MLQELGASQEQFLLAAKRGLEDPNDKKYFEQLIACDNYLYFKSMLVKRNLQLEEQAFKLMQEKLGNTATDKFTLDPHWQEIQKKKQDIEMEIAIQMSLALEEEKKKLLDLEDEELRVLYYLKYFAIRERLSSAN
jgi:hypothetical protein